MDEAYVVLVADPGAECQAFPFATKVGAEKAAEWFRNISGFSSIVIDDHEEEGG